MSEFNSQAEVWGALLGGKTICAEDFRYKFFDGNLLESKNLGCYNVSYQQFKSYHYFSTYAEPKVRKTIKMAPALCEFEESNTYYIAYRLFRSEEEARKAHTNLVKWLIDTPYAIDVEIEDVEQAEELAQIQEAVPYDTYEELIAVYPKLGVDYEVLKTIKELRSSC